MATKTDPQQDPAIEAAGATVDALEVWPDNVPDKTKLLADANALEAAITAAEFPSPPPAFVRFPDTDLVLDAREQLFCGIPDGLWNSGGVSMWQQQSLSDPSAKPGMWVSTPNAPIRLETIGGDWFGADGVKQSLVPFGLIPVNDLGSAVAGDFISTDVSALVQQWIDGTLPDWGFALRNNDNSSIVCNALTLKVTVDGVESTIAPGSLLPLTTAGYVSFAGRTPWNIAPNWVIYAWFDLSVYKGMHIESARLVLSSTNQFGKTTVLVLRARNHAYDNPPNPIEYGLAANYIGDVGIENDPDVLGVIDFTDPNFEKTAWMNGLGVKYGTSSSLVEVITDPAQMLAGKFAVLRCKFTAGGPQSALERHSQLIKWRGYNGLHPLDEPPMQINARYYWRPNNGQFGEPVWRPSPAGGKLPGPQARYTAIGQSYVNVNQPVLIPTLPGCGLGNSGSTCTGQGNYSARMNFDPLPGPGTPLERLAGFGGNDCYNADQAGFYGNFQFADIGTGGHIRLGEWGAIEIEAIRNTVTDPDQKPLHVKSITNNNDGTATAQLMAPCVGNPKYASGQLWTIAGVNFYTDATKGAVGKFNQVAKPITVINETTFTYPIPAGTGAVATPANGPQGAVWMIAVASQGNFDGVLRYFLNGRMVGENARMCFTHSHWLPDGSHVAGFETMWWLLYQGGGKLPNLPASSDFAKCIVATKRIGPMVFAP